MVFRRARDAWKPLVSILLILAVFLPKAYAPFAFSISVAPDTVSVPQGWSTKANVSLTLLDTPVRTVTLSAAKAPNEPSITVAFTPSSGDPSYASRMDISTTTSTPEGSYSITVTGTPSSGTPQSTVLTLIVTSLFTLGVTPASGSVLPGGSSTTSISVGGVQETVIYSYQIKYADSDGNDSWDTGEAVVLDGNDNGVFDSGEAVIAGAPVVGTPLKFDLRIGFVDGSGNNAWDSGETVVCDCNGNGVYDTNEPVILGSPPAGGTTVKRSQLLTGTIPTWGTLLEDDTKIKYQDLNNNSARDGTECTFYDNDNGNDFDAAEPVLAGTCPGSGTVRDDLRVKYVDSNNNNLWVAEAVNLSCSSPPAGVGCSFSVSGGIPSYNSVLSIATPPSISPGIYAITVRGTSAGSGVVRETVYTLLVPAVVVTPSEYHGSVGNQFTFNVTVVGFPSFASFDIIVGYNHTSVGGPLDALMIIPPPSSDPEYVWPSGATVFTTASSVDSPVGQVRFSQASTLPTSSGVNGVLFSVRFNITQPGTTKIIFVRDVVNLGGNVVAHIAVEGRFCKILPDINNDGVVNVVDLARVGTSFGKSEGDPGFDPAADLNGDHVVNVADLATVGTSFGRTC